MTNKIEKFTWLASYPKSGNTWLRMLLTAYRNGGFIDINRADYTQGDNYEYYTRVVSPLPLKDLGYRGKMLVRPAALLHQLTANLNDIRFIKTHHANITGLELAPYIPAELTERAIYVLRDPRDVLLSMSLFTGYSLNEMVQNMNDPKYGIGTDITIPHHLSSWSQHVKSWTEDDRFPVLAIRYEDLLQDAALELAKVLDFCGLETDSKRVVEAVEACHLHKLREQEEQYGFKENVRTNVKRFFARGGTRWQEDLADDLVAQIEEDHGSVMQQWGYQLTENEYVRV